MLLTIFFIIATIVCYLTALWCHRSSGGNPFLHPLISTSAMVLGVLWLSDFSVADYQHHASVLHWWLGPATVALAIPLYSQLSNLVRLGHKAILPIILGGILAPLLAVLSLIWLSAPEALTQSMMIKSITTPLAMDVAQLTGGVPGLAAVYVIITGVVGAAFSGWVFSVFRVHDERDQGVALGTVAHAVGTSRAVQIGERCGAFSTLALCLNGILTAIVLPLIFG